MSHIPPWCGLERRSGMFVLGLAVVLASCGWQARHAADQDAVSSPSGAQSSAREPIATHTYFGAEFEAEQSALRDAPIEPPVQAF
jgi:hypothetical protein